MTDFNRIAYERMDLCNPVSQAAVEAMLDQAGAGPGARAVELGCGNGALAALMARRGWRVLAVDRGEAMVELARRRLAEAGLEARVVRGEAAEVAADQGPWDVAAAMGTTGLVDFSRLAALLAPDGRLLWGDLFWAAAADPALAAILGAGPYDTAAGLDARLAELAILAQRVSPPEDWEAYVGAVDRAVGAWAAEAPADPDRSRILARRDAMLALWGGPARRALGFRLLLLGRKD